MEKVKTEQINVEEQARIFSDDIDFYLQRFMEENGIDSLKKESQSVWNAALMYVHNNVFNIPNILKSKKILENKTSKIKTNYNAYDYDLVNNICDVYIYHCMMNDKEVSLTGFSLLTGIALYTLMTWRDEGTKLSPASYEIGKKLQDYCEESLANKLATGKQNPVGVIAILNRRYGWASPYTADARRQQVISDEKLPKLQNEPLKIDGENQ